VESVTRAIGYAQLKQSIGVHYQLADARSGVSSTGSIVDTAGKTGVLGNIVNGIKSLLPGAAKAGGMLFYYLFSSSDHFTLWNSS